MLKTEIRLNKDKIQKEGRYAAESLYAAIDKVFSKHGFGKIMFDDGTIAYIGNGKKGIQEKTFKVMYKSSTGNEMEYME